MSPYQSSGPEIAEGREFIVRAPSEHEGGAGALGRPYGCGSDLTGSLLRLFSIKSRVYPSLVHHPKVAMPKEWT